MNPLASIKSISVGTVIMFTACASAQSDSLREAIIRGETVTVGRLVKEEGGVNRKYKYNTTPLSIAVAQGQLEVVRALLKAGADPNVVNSFGHSIWFTASAIPRPETREAMKSLLVEHGCRTHEINPDGRSGPIGRPSETHPLVPPSRQLPLPDESKDQRELEHLKKIFEKEPPDFNKATPSHPQAMTWLMRAAAEGSVPAVSFFLEKGSHVGVKDYDGKTALDYARAVTSRPPEVRARLVALLEEAEKNPANGAGVTYPPAPRPLNLMTAYKEAQENPQPLDYFEAVAAFQKFSTLTEYQQMVLGNRAARWLRGNESIAGWAKQILVANSNSQVHLPLVRMLISAQNNQALSRQTIDQLEKAETDPKKLQIYKQMKP